MDDTIRKAVWLSELVYDDKEIIKNRLLFQHFYWSDFVESEYTDTQVLITGDEDRLFVIFRGTEPDKIQDWINNLGLRLLNTAIGKVHHGFYNCCQSVQVATAYKINTLHQDIIICGHSQGAAVATLFAMWLSHFHNVHKIVQVGCPRLMGKKTAEEFGKTHGSRTHRIVNNNDIVTRIPPEGIGYSHIIGANLHYFKEDGSYTQDISEWDLLKDMVDGRIKDIGEWGTDGIKDHSIHEYVRLINTI